MNRMRLTLLFLGDIAALYLGLFLTLVIRYGGGFYGEFADHHFVPFTVIFVFWLIIFYIAGLYELPRLRNTIDFSKTLFSAIAINTALSVAFFYAIPSAGITPKTNLLLFVAIFSILSFLWRRFFNTITAPHVPKRKLLIAGASHAADAIRDAVAHDPHLGYEIAFDIPEGSSPSGAKKLVAGANNAPVDEVIVPWSLKHDEALGHFLYKLLARNVTVRDVPTFYEYIFRKIPVEGVEEAWMLEHIAVHPRFYDNLKRAAEFLLALIIGVVLLPIEILIAILIKLTSRGPVIIRQARTGKLGAVFTLYKFRSMLALSPDGQAETAGAQWSAPEDNRITPFGKIIRYTHLDELPQLINIIKGNLSFVGPRPERPEFVEILKKKIPYYELRHLVNPGVTGWAQVNYHYTASIEEAREKLEYDLYYIKNRSIILDVGIVLKTAKALLINESWVAQQLS